ncbi:RHS repeat-associated core domain-containing protein [Massilia sp. YMA4]|uniref:RHS repeat-associated core domain-containing protein n=1 Tax=Massilia sp. YMA4 TaxID=1593482 RepID=UPI000DD147E5|nr:RHS repeat-associated core domain-containing protein [Massilia sp. YMA4]AXA91170.1 type IV secretion protein Rhs [Massilia sp. YMA4]
MTAVLTKEILRRFGSASLIRLGDLGPVGLLAYGMLCNPAAYGQAIQDSTYYYGHDNNGNPTRTTDPRGQVTKYDYDEFGALKAITKPSPTIGLAQPVVSTKFDYRGNLQALTDPRSLQTILAVNGHGETTLLTSPDTGKTVSTYDPNGNRVSSTDARNITATYRYDALNRLVRAEYPGWTTSLFEYDGGAAGGIHNIGRLTRISDESGSTAYTYDTLGRLESKAQTTRAWNGNSTHTAIYSYGSAGVEAGKLRSVTYPSGNRLVYQYDRSGRLKNILLNPVNANGSGFNSAINTVLLQSIGYDATGKVRAWAWGNSTVSIPNENVREFDLDGRIHAYRLGNPASSGIKRVLTYDPAGRIVATTDTDAKGTVTRRDYGYDNLNRLTSATGTSSYRYAYDASDNRVSTSVGNVAHLLTISPTSNRLAATTGPKPAKNNVYDEAGNLLSDGTVEYRYSPRGRLIKVVNAGTTVLWRYNALGQRVEKNSGEVFYYDEGGRLIGEYSKLTGRVVREIVYLYDEPVALLTQTVTASATGPVIATNIYYIYSDHLGAPRWITQATDNAVRWRWDHADPFGLQPPNDNPAGLGMLAFNLRLPGQYYDRESNLHYNYFRDYDPQTGRYVQSDPIGLAGGINTYGYVGGNPVSQFDPSGLNCVAAGGTVTCNVPGGPQIQFPRPAGWPASMQGGDSGYHYYNEWVKTAGLDKKCIEDYIRNHPTPGSPKPATSKGTANNASPSWVPSFMPSPVMSYSMSSGGSQVVVNVTMPGHPLFPGYVARTVGSSGTINNFGEGTGRLQSSYSPFARPINNVWHGLTDDVINACRCK